MSLYAELNEAGRVLRVIVADDPEWIHQRLGGTWAETVMQDEVEQYAGPGMYHSELPPSRFVPEWRQPVGSEDAYPEGQWVWHAGQVWENLTPANVWEPGVTGWRDPLSEWPDWIQPLGAQDAYPLGAKVTHEDQRWVSNTAANIWEPGVFGWDVQVEEGGEPPAEPAPPQQAPPDWEPWDGNNASLYQIGDVVTHAGREWTATHGNNHWEPGVFGWA